MVVVVEVVDVVEVVVGGVAVVVGCAAVVVGAAVDVAVGAAEGATSAALFEQAAMNTSRAMSPLRTDQCYCIAGLQTRIGRPGAQSGAGR